MKAKKQFKKLTELLITLFLLTKAIATSRYVNLPVQQPSSSTIDVTHDRGLSNVGWWHLTSITYKSIHQRMLVHRIKCKTIRFAVMDFLIDCPLFSFHELNIITYKVYAI